MSEVVIETDNLSRAYGDLVAVDGICLKVPSRSVYGFLGPNGAGKTTTIRMLLGLIRPTKGQVRLFGEPLNRDPLLLMKRVGALVETPSLYPHLTGHENLEVTRRLIGAERKQIERVLSIVRLERDAHRRVREYSHGMRQRLALALALLNEPDLLILDEPTNGLDPAGIREMRELIRSFPKQYDVTVFLSSHLLSEVEQVATHIGIINKGCFLFQGTLSELKTRRHERVLLTVDRGEAAVQMLQRAGWTVQAYSDNQFAVLTKGQASAAEINALLVGQGINVVRLDVEESSLEAIFLQLTNSPD